MRRGVAPGRPRAAGELGELVVAHPHPPAGIRVMDHLMVPAAEQDQVVQVGGANVGAALQVVGVAPVKRFSC